MVEDLISEIEELDEPEFTEFHRYHEEMQGRFIQGSSEDAYEARSNTQALQEEGGSPLLLAGMHVLLSNSEGAEEFADYLREYRKDPATPNKVGGDSEEFLKRMREKLDTESHREAVDATIEEVYSSFFYDE